MKEMSFGNQAKFAALALKDVTSLCSNFEVPSEFLVNFYSLQDLYKDHATMIPKVAEICETWIARCREITAIDSCAGADKNQWHLFIPLLNSTLSAARAAVAQGAVDGGRAEGGQGPAEILTGGEKGKTTKQKRCRVPDFKRRRDHLQAWALQKMVGIISAWHAPLLYKLPSVKEWVQLYRAEHPDLLDNDELGIYLFKNALSKSDQRGHPAAPAILTLDILRSMAERMHLDRRKEEQRNLEQRNRPMAAEVPSPLSAAAEAPSPPLLAGAAAERSSSSSAKTTAVLAAPAAPTAPAEAAASELRGASAGAGTQAAGAAAGKPIHPPPEKAAIQAAPLETFRGPESAQVTEDQTAATQLEDNVILQEKAYSGGKEGVVTAKEGGEESAHFSSLLDAAGIPSGSTKASTSPPALATGLGFGQAPSRPPPESVGNRGRSTTFNSRQRGNRRRGEESDLSSNAKGRNLSKRSKRKKTGDEESESDSDDNRPLSRRVPVVALAARIATETSSGSPGPVQAGCSNAAAGKAQGSETGFGGPPADFVAGAAVYGRTTGPPGMPMSAGAGLRPSAAHLNGPAVGDCPADGLNMGARSSDAMMLSQGGVEVSRPYGTQPELMLTATVCRAIWRTSLIGTESALYCSSSESKDPQKNSESDTPTLAAVFPPNVMQLLNVANDDASPVQGDIRFLENVLADKTSLTSQHTLIELRIFRETALAFLARVAAATCSNPMLNLFHAKAEIMHAKLEEEFVRRTPSHCGCCWSSGPVVVCGCGDCYCQGCGACYRRGAVQTGTEIIHIVCNICRLEAGILDNLSFQTTSAATGSHGSDAIMAQTNLEMVSAGSRCLNCGQVVATRLCSSCSTSFCVQCAVTWKPELLDAQLRCRSCTPEMTYAAQWTRIEESLQRMALPNHRQSLGQDHAPKRGAFAAALDKARPFAIKMTELYVSSRLCGLYLFADQLFRIVHSAAAAQISAGAESSITPQQIISSLGPHSCAGAATSTTLLRMVLEARALRTKAEASKADKTRRPDGNGDRGGRVAGPIRIGYWITAASWSSSRFECVVPWLTKVSAPFSATLILLGGEEAHLQALEEMLQASDRCLVTEGALPAQTAILRISEKMSDEEAFAQVRSSNLDISVDLDCGFGARPALISRKGLSRRIVHAVGIAFPQPKKDRNCDFILGDDRALQCSGGSGVKETVAPVLKVSVSRPFWISRAVAAMQTCSRTRADYELPSAGFIFMHIEEVSPASPGAMRTMLSILHGTPGSFLVMIGQTMWAKASLRDEARAYASSLPSSTKARFDPELRVLFRPWPEHTYERINLMRHGDLLLADHEGGSVTAAGLLALAACLPALVCVREGGCFGVLRDISGALKYMGLGEELVVNEERKFIEKAQELGNHQASILFVKEYLQTHITAGTALFSEERQIHEWEHALDKVHRNDDDDTVGNDIDATLSTYQPCEPLRFPWRTPEQGPGPRSEAIRAGGLQTRSYARAEVQNQTLKTAMERERFVLEMAKAYREFDNFESKAQLDSIFQDAQINGVALRKLAGGGGFSCVVLGFLEGASIVESAGVTGVALVFERRKAPADRLFNRPLFRYAVAVTSSRRRHTHDEFMVRPVRIFEKGTSCFSISVPDEKGESIFCLVVEELAQGYLEGLQSDIDNWTRDLRLTEGLRCDVQELLHAVNMIHQSSIVHGDIKPQNIMRNSKGGLVLCDWGSGWNFNCNAGGRDRRPQLLQRRATSMAVVIEPPREKHDKKNKKRRQPEVEATASKKPTKIKTVGPPAKERIVRKNLPRRPKGCSMAPAAALRIGNGSLSDTLSILPNGRKPIHLSDKAIVSILQSLAVGGEGLATVGPATALFRRRPQPETGKVLTKEEGMLDDAFAVFRTLMILLRPLINMSVDEWVRKAREAEISVEAMQHFLQHGRSGTGTGSDRQGSGRAATRLAEFIWRGITKLDLKESQTHEFVTLPVYPEEIDWSIFRGTGFLVQGGKMSTAPGCPMKFWKETLKDVRVIMEPGIDGAGLQAVESYETGETISYYLGRRRIGTEIHNFPPGRYTVAVKARAEYCNGEFTKERTLEWFALRKAVGVCINAPQRNQKRNCVLLRSQAQQDTEGNIWIPIKAAKNIGAGEFFCFTYDHEAAGGYGYSFATH